MQNIRQAVANDSSIIANLISDADFIHRHLDWTPLLEWITSSPFLISEVEGKLTGLLACPPDPAGVAWVKCFACNNPSVLMKTFKAFLDTIREEKLLNTDYLYVLGLQDWFIRLLVENQFSEFQKVVVLQHQAGVNPPSKATTALIRPMQMSDIQEVAELDSLAFEPIWVISPHSMKFAFLQSAHASVIDLDGKICGYELSTSSSSSAHLARVAVHPDHQNENLASTLIREMIAHFHRNNIFSITVNTQKENHQSMALYRKTGFHLTGEQYPIYRLKI